MIKFSKEKIIFWLIYAYLTDANLIINYINLNHFELYITSENDKKYFLQNCLDHLSKFGKFDTIVELDKIYKIDWNQSILINKELGDNINNIPNCKIFIFSENNTNP